MIVFIQPYVSIYMSTILKQDVSLLATVAVAVGSKNFSYTEHHPSILCITFLNML